MLVFHFTIQSLWYLHHAVPPTMVTSFSSIDVNVTEEVRVTCGVGEGSEDVRWEWRVNSSEVVTSGRILYDRTGTVRDVFSLSREVFRLLFLYASFTFISSS